MNIEIFPLEKVVIDEKEILLQMERSEVEKILGPRESGDTWGDSYYQGQLKISYDLYGKVELIEFISNEDGLRPFVYGADVFSEQADKICNILLEKNNGGITDKEEGRSYIFTDLGICVSRENTPDDVQDMLVDAQISGKETNFDELTKKMEQADHFDRIKVSIRQYYALEEMFWGQML